MNEKTLRIRDFSFHKNTQLEILKYIKNATKNSPYPIITGPTGIGKTSLMNTIFRHLNYNPIYVTPSPKINEKLKSTPKKAFNNQKQIFFIDELDVIEKEYNFIDEIFRYRSKYENGPFIIFCCCDIYSSPLFRYRKDCKIFNLQVTDIDIGFIIDNLFKNKIYSHAELVKQYNMDIRSIINNIYIGRFSTECDISNKPMGLYKTVNDIMSINLKNKNRKVLFYDYLDLINEEYGNKFYELCYENFILNGRNIKNVCKISECNSMLHLLHKKYRNIFFDAINNICNSKENIEIINYNFLRKSKNNLPKMVHECVKLKLETNIGNNIKNFDYFMLYFLKEVIYLLNNKNVKSLISIDINDFSSLLENFMKKEVILKFMANISRDKKTVNLILKKEFRYKYKDGVSTGARMNVGIDKLFD